MADPSMSQHDPAAATDANGSPLDLLGDLEQRLSALKSWQNQSEAQAAKVREQSKDLDERKAELDAKQAELDGAWSDYQQKTETLEADLQQAEQARAELERHRAEIQSEQQALDAKRSEVEAHLAEVGQQIEASRAAAEAELAERRREAEAAAQERRQQAEHEAEERLSAVAELERDLAESHTQAEKDHEHNAAQRAELDAASEALKQREDDLQRRHDELTQKLQALEEQSAALDHRKADFEKVTAELDSARAELESRANELDLKAEEIGALRNELETEIDQLGERQTRIEAGEQELEQHRQEVAKTRQELQRVKLDQQLKADSLEAQEAALTKAREELLASAGAADAAPTPDAQRDEALSMAKAELERHRVAAEQSARELEAVRAQVDEREQELASVRDELNALRSDGGSGSATSDDETALLEELEAREQEVAALRDQLGERTEQLNDANARITELEQKLESAQADSDPDTQEKLADREREVDDLRSDLDSRIAEVQVLRGRIEQLTADLAKIEQSGGKGKKDGKLAADLARRQTELDEQAAQVAADRERILERKAQLKQADEIIKKRREKIKRYIEQLKEHAIRVQADADGEVPVVTPTTPPALNTPDHAQLAGLEKQRESLAEIQKLLEQSEAAMVRRWATQRVTSTVTGLLVMLIAAAGFSYAVGSQLAIPTYRATMAVKVTPEEGSDAVPPNAWLANYRQTLLSKPVMAEAINQLDQRSLRIPGVNTADQLRSHLRDTLSVEGDPSRVQIAYVGEDPELIGEVLDAYGKGLMIYHMTEDRRVGTLDDTVKSMQPAAAEPKPIQDDRLRYAGIVFGGILAAGLLIALPLRVAYGRSRKVLDPSRMPELSMLDKPETWSPLPAHPEADAKTDDSLAELAQTAEQTGDGEGDDKQVFRI